MCIIVYNNCSIYIIIRLLKYTLLPFIAYLKQRKSDQLEFISYWLIKTGLPKQAMFRLYLEAPGFLCNIIF